MKNELDLWEEGKLLETTQYVDESGKLVSITEEVYEWKKDAQIYIISKINNYIKENNPKSNFKSSTAPPSINIFCTDQNSKLLIITGALTPLAYLKLMCVGGVAGVVLPVVGGYLVGMQAANESNRRLMEYVKKNKSDIENYVNDNWEHKIRFSKFIKKDKFYPDRIVIEFTKNGGKKSTTKESVIYNF